MRTDDVEIHDHPQFVGQGRVDSHMEQLEGLLFPVAGRIPELDLIDGDADMVESDGGDFDEIGLGDVGQPFFPPGFTLREPVADVDTAPDREFFHRFP